MEGTQNPDGNVQLSVAYLGPLPTLNSPRTTGANLVKRLFTM